MLTVAYLAVVALLVYGGVLQAEPIVDSLTLPRLRTGLARLLVMAWLAGSFSAMAGMLLLGGAR